MTVRVRISHEGDSKSNHRLLIQKSFKGHDENFKSNVEPGDSVDVIVYKDLKLTITEERIIEDKETNFDIL